MFLGRFHSIFHTKNGISKCCCPTCEWSQFIICLSAPNVELLHKKHDLLHGSCSSTIYSSNSRSSCLSFSNYFRGRCKKVEMLNWTSIIDQLCWCALHSISRSGNSCSSISKYFRGKHKKVEVSNWMSTLDRVCWRMLHSFCCGFCASQLITITNISFWKLQIKILPILNWMFWRTCFVPFEIGIDIWKNSLCSNQPLDNCSGSCLLHLFSPTMSRILEDWSSYRHVPFHKLHKK